jgi:hypothetical protein
MVGIVCVYSKEGKAAAPPAQGASSEAYGKHTAGLIFSYFLFLLLVLCSVYVSGVS